MNIETLNQWGGHFLHFAWAMLWQSSLLIVVIFALDFLLAKRIRASVRYALWLVVLVKLILPPALALPTSPVWWWHKTVPIVTKEHAAHFSVTYDSQPLPASPPATFAPPKPVLTSSAWLLTVSTSISVILLLWLLARWQRISRQIRCSETVERLTALAIQARRCAGIKFKSNPPVKLTANTMSPAVCGLFNPAILIPQSLAENFSDEQLRAVLLHEMIHLRRGDVWVNCSQALLQIFYWWHPLLWFANSRIRRLREEAVDDVVMLALNADAEVYAPTLLEVAKFAFHRPLASLGLVGILESRSALRQRIERLMNFSAPRKAGLTFLSLWGIFILSAVALPMGEGPAENQPDLTSSEISPASERNLIEQVMITTHFYWMDDANLKKAISTLKSDSSGNDSSWPVLPGKLNSFTKHLESLGLHAFSGPRVVTINHETAEISVTQGTNGVNITCTPNVTNEFVNLVIHGTVNEDSIHGQFTTNSILQDHGGIVISAKFSESNLLAVVGVQIISTNFFKRASQNGVAPEKISPNETKQSAQALQPIQTTPSRKEILAKLNHIQLDRVHFENVSLSEAVHQLAEDAKLHDPEHKGVNFIINPNLDLSGSPMIDSTTGLLTANPPSDTGASESIDLGTNVTVTLNLTNVSLAQVLDAIVDLANHPPGYQIKYSIEDYGVVFSWKRQTSPQLYNRTFRLNTNVFLANLRRQVNVNFDSTELIPTIRQLFTNAGVDLSPPKAIFYNDGLGMLFVRATASDLDKVEKILVNLNDSSSEQQIHIKARFLEVPAKGFIDPALFASATNRAANQMTGILTSENARTILRLLQSKPGVEELAEPEVTTIVGRQTQMRATQMITIVTNFVYGKSQTHPFIESQTSKIETGPVLDSIAKVSADGYTIDLEANVSLTEFFGYGKNDDPFVTAEANGNNSSLPSVSPNIRVQKASAHVQLYDGQTLILGKFGTKTTGNGNFAKSDNKELLVLVTVNLVDRVGNRLHSDSDLSFAQNSFPPQTFFPPQN